MLRSPRRYRRMRRMSSSSTPAPRKFPAGGPITMTAEDVAQVCRVRPAAKLIAVHMETINHCGLTRVELRRQLDAVSISEQVIIPDDGESVVL